MSLLALMAARSRINHASTGAWLTLVKVTPGANGGASTTLVIPTSTATLVGDTLILVLASYYGDARAHTITDDAGNTYTRIATYTDSYSKQKDVYSAPVTSASGAATVTVTAGSADYFAGVVYQTRGTPLALASGGALTASRTQTLPGTTPLPLGTLTTSVPAFCVLLGAAAGYGTTYPMAMAPGTLFAIDAAQNVGGNYPAVFASYVSTAPISDSGEGIYMPGRSSNTGMGGALVPLVGSTLAVSLNNTTTANGVYNSSGTSTVSTPAVGYITATPSGGSGSYTHNWVFVSGDNTITPTAPTSASTKFPASVPLDSTKTAVYQDIVNDGVAQVSSAQETITLTNSSGPP